MATTPTKPEMAGTASFTESGAPAWPRGQSAAANPLNPSHDVVKEPTDGRSSLTYPARDHSSSDHSSHGHPPRDFSTADDSSNKPSQLDGLQALLAFSALHQQVRRRRALAAQLNGFDAAPQPEFERDELFVLDEVLQLIAERAIAITGADGMAIALAQNDEIVLRAAAGTVRPDVGARIDRDSAFSGASFRMAQVVMCDDTETDPRVNLEACRRLDARSMIAVPLCGRRRVIGLLEAFSSWPFGFNDSDIRNLTLLAELIVGALRPEDEDRFADSADVAATKLEPAARAVGGVVVSPAIIPAKPPARVEVASPIATIPAAIPTPVTSAPVIAPAAAIPVKPLLAPTPIISAKPAEVKASATADILDRPEVATEKIIEEEIEEEIEKASAPKASVAEAATPELEPELNFGQAQAEAATRRPGLVVLLLCVVVAVAFAGGAWYKLRSSQMGAALVTEKTLQQQTAETPATNAAAQTTGAPAVTNSATSNSTTAPATAVPDAMSPTAEEDNTPATPQELAKFPRVTGIRHWSSATSSTVVLDLEDQVQYEAHRLTSPDRIYFDLRDTQLTAEAAKSVDVAGDTLLNRVRVAQPIAGMSRVVLETKADSNFSVSLEPNPYRLVIEVRKVGVTPKAAVNLFPNAEAEKNRLAIVVPPPTKEDLQLRTHISKLRIVVDAGHGGWDLGTVGRRGLLEKDLVLEIAQRLGKLLESRLGAEIIYTRQDDNYIPLDDRAGIANQAQADLFISVHANYSDLPSARGVETYYTNSFSAPGAREAGSKDTGQRIADAAAAGVKTPTLSATDLHERIEQSRRLAASVQRSLYGTLAVQNPGLRDRGIKEAGFVVLTESAMPGILAEVSFVSSPADEQKLRSDGYREQIAEALYKGIARYAAAAKPVKMAAK
jgi:N-acetylmuramoyl-L-alanine amidase/putative methionine-R-sulfoxide reductase with GAF domain